MTVKAPITPEAAARMAAVPTSWRTAFADLADRMMRVIGKQASTIAAQRADLEDARALLARTGETVTALVDGARQADQRAAGLAKDLADAVAAVGTLTAAVEALTAVREVADYASSGVDLAVEQVKALDQRVGVVVLEVARLADGARQADQRTEDLAGLTVAAGRRVDALERANDAVDQRLTAEVTRVTALVDDLAATASGEDGALDQRVTALAADVTGRLDALAIDVTGRTVALTARVGAIAGTVDQTTATVSGLVESLGSVTDAVQDVAGKVKTLIDARADDVVDLRAVEQRVVELQGVAMRNVETIDDLTGRVRAVEPVPARIDALAEDVAGCAAMGQQVKAEVARFGATIAQTGEQCADTLRRVTIALNEIPSGMMIDQDGMLHRVNKSGEAVKIGRVVMPATNGRDAADIVSARLDGDRLIFARSDRSEFGCSFAAVLRDAATPPTPAEPIDPAKLGYLSKDPVIKKAQIDDMTAMRAKGKGYKAIGSKYGISERHVARLIIEAKK